MQKVRGIGGVFLYAEDPAALSDWYARHLGIEIIVYETGKTYAHEFSWDPDAPTMMRNTTWSLMKAKEPLSGPKTGTVNYIVDDLEAMVAQLRGGGVTVEKVEHYEYGHFAWAEDPEGNKIELYQPEPEAA